MANECSVCDESFSSWHYKDKHEREQHPNLFSYECPTCGKMHKSEKGVNTHHKQSHGDSLSSVGVVCENCGESMTVFSHKKERNANHFCSQECYGQWRSEMFVGKKHPNWCSNQESAKEKYKCKNCSEEVWRYPSQVNDLVFCSDECYLDWVEKEYSGRKHPDWSGGRKDVECDICGDEVQRYEDEIESTSVTVCSRECLYEWTSSSRDMPSGEDHWAWEGGPVDFGEDWYEMRAKIRERDEVCQKCGEDGSGDQLHVHHIVPRREFENVNESNTRDNLILVCRSCHMKVEKGDASCPKPNEENKVIS